MSHMASGILGVVAGTLALGAVHLEVAAGNDFLGPVQRGDARAVDSAAPQGATEIASHVNRAAKGDRHATVQLSEGVTIAFKMPGVSDTSYMMRVPVGDAADAVKRASSPNVAGKGSVRVRSPVACEAVVSVLTAVARQLQPGRCVT